MFREISVKSRFLTILKGSVRTNLTNDILANHSWNTLGTSYLCQSSKMLNISVLNTSQNSF